MSEKWAELQELCEAVVEGRLDEAGMQRLDVWVRDDAAARAFYVRYLHQHACLQWSGVGPPREKSEPEPRPRLRFRAGRLAAAVLALAAGLLVAVWLGWPSAAPVVATLESGKECKWDESTLPTQVGASLTAGRLRLAEGLARIVFASGAEVALEAPADLELLSARRCVLHAGRLVAKVPPQAVGFIVDTPTAVLEDQGTEFGVHVRDNQTADVSVFQGLVNARHRVSGKKERMTTGERLRFRPDGVGNYAPLEGKPPGREREASGPVVQISTATGRGKDAYVQPVIGSKHRSDILLLVKNALPEAADYNRKAYLGLDLRSLQGKKLLEAELTIAFAPTGMGFASLVGDATFAVYGLTDRTLDGWDEKTLRWNNAPANQPGGSALDASKVELLGKFVIRQGEMTGARSIQGEALRRFVVGNADRVATFILVRETAGRGRGDLVHGFAGKNHPHLPPPTLKATVKEGG